MCRLICAFVVRIWLKQVFSWRGPFYLGSYICLNFGLHPLLSTVPISSCWYLRTLCIFNNSSPHCSEDRACFRNALHMHLCACKYIQFVHYGFFTRPSSTNGLRKKKYYSTKNNHQEQCAWVDFWHREMTWHDVSWRDVIIVVASDGTNQLANVTVPANEPFSNLWVNLKMMQNVVKL